MATYSPAQFAAAGGKANSSSGVDYSPLQDFIKQNVPTAVSPTKSGDGLATGMAKDAFSTLLVKPAVRVAQVAAAPLVQQKMDSTTSIQNQQTDQLNLVLAKLKTETDPTKKAALSQMAHKLVDQASANTAEGQQATAANNSLGAGGNTHVLGQDIAGQATGAAGVKQIAGDALKSASYLAVPEVASETGAGATAAERIVSGAKGGAVVGAAGGAGSELEDPNSTAGSVLEAGGKGAAGGALVGGAIPAFAEGFKNLSEASQAEKVSSEASNQTALDAIKNPLSKTEQESALRGGRLAESSKKGLNPKIAYEPDVSSERMAKSLQPMVEDGRIKPPTNVVNQEQNILETGKEIGKQSDDLRAGLKQSDAAAQAKVQEDQTAFKNMTADEKASYKAMNQGKPDLSKNKLTTKQLRAEMDTVKVPDPVKNDTVLSKNVKSLKDAAAELYKKIPDHQSEAILNLKHNFDDYVKENYGPNFFDKGRNADPFHQYTYALRDKYTQLMADRLPEGNLPNGTSIKDAFLNQHNLINAQDEMVAKTTREFPEGSTPMQRFLQAHPILKRIGLREAISIGGGAIGLTAIGSMIHKDIVNAGK